MNDDIVNLITADIATELGGRSRYSMIMWVVFAFSIVYSAFSLYTQIHTFISANVIAFGWWAFMLALFFVFVAPVILHSVLAIKKKYVATIVLGVISFIFLCLRFGSPNLMGTPNGINTYYGAELVITYILNAVLAMLIIVSLVIAIKQHSVSRGSSVKK